MKYLLKKSNTKISIYFFKDKDDDIKKYEKYSLDNQSAEDNN